MLNRFFLAFIKQGSSFFLLKKIEYGLGFYMIRG